MPNVLFRITVLCVNAMMILKVIHLEAANEKKLSRKNHLANPAIHLPVDPMLFAKNAMVLDRVPACLITLAIPTKAADLNVYKIQIVP